jgi:uncharacterized repeat protein (TIGR03803 family)
VDDGQNPTGSLTQSGSAFFGTTVGGGNGNNGTVFTVNGDASGFGLVRRFAGPPGDGSSPFGSLVQAGPALYGMTGTGGAANLGTVFKVNGDGSGYAVLHSFAGGAADGQHPRYGSLVQSGSTFYGMTQGGGAAGDGVVFKVNGDGTGFAVLHSFDFTTLDGSDPLGSLVLSGSTLYGMTAFGGATLNGTIFKMNTNGAGYSILHSFAGGPADGSGPQGSLTLSGSTLYGMTATGGAANDGTIFQLLTDGTGYQVLHSFAGGPADGANPEGDLLLSGSSLYGMTSVGGANNLGVVFSFPVPIPEPSTILPTAAGGGFAVLLARRRSNPSAASGGRG